MWFVQILWITKLLEKVPDLKFLLVSWIPFGKFYLILLFTILDNPGSEFYIQLRRNKILFYFYFSFLTVVWLSWKFVRSSLYRNGLICFQDCPRAYIVETIRNLPKQINEHWRDFKSGKFSNALAIPNIFTNHRFVFKHSNIIAFIHDNNSI